MERDKSEPNPHFVNPRDEVLYTMAQQGWANESGGRHEGAVGYIARVSNAPNELDEIVSAFVHELDKLEYSDTQELIGHFLVWATVRVGGAVRYDDELQLKRDFNELIEFHKIAEGS